MDRRTFVKNSVATGALTAVGVASLGRLGREAPAATTVRVYADLDADLARAARATSGTATLECEGVDECLVAESRRALVFFQAVGTCIDGVVEGPN